MSALIWAIYGTLFVVGLALSVPLERALGRALPWRYGRYLARGWINNGLRRGEAWAVNESEGRRYEIAHLEDGDLPNSLVAEGDDGRIYEDVGLMGHIDAGGSRVPLGCTFSGHRVISSPLVAKIGEQYGDKETDSPLVDQRLMTDGGAAQADTSTTAFDRDVSVNELREKALMGRGYQDGIAVEVVNGAATIPDSSVADIKETVRVLKHAGDPEQPKRAAENAENAERARTSDKSTFDKLKPFAYIMIGGLLVYIGMRNNGGGGGGGGGGGVPDGPVGVAVPDLTPVVDVLTSGVLV